ncbi:MAG: nuclear transport factor 2 family protein [Actinobacteria bacterium]|nr:nuclear transport factor 2 family protein [Actinomycetota bacterium]
MVITDELRQRREAVVGEHMSSENELDFDRTIATFARPRYELIPTGEVFDGEQAVREYFRASRAAVPDQRNELIGMTSTDHAVIVEFWLRGTPATRAGGNGFVCRMVAIFEFEPGGSGIVCERVYWDRETIRRQLSAQR